MRSGTLQVDPLPKASTLSDLLEQIGQALSEGWIELDLSDKGLVDLPVDIAKLTGLRSLDLRNNQLTSLPDSIAQLTGLQSLDLRGNQLTSLLDSFGQLTGLQSLYLDGNQLTSLPDSFAQLTGLKLLDLDGNQLTSPPPDIVAQGTNAILTFLRERIKDGQRQWTSRMLLVAREASARPSSSAPCSVSPSGRAAPKLLALTSGQLS